MKKFLLAGLLGALLMPSVVMAQSSFDGTWKIDVSKAQMPKKPDVLLLQNGMYECKTCAPAISIKADGDDHPVTGHPYFDTMAIKVVDDHTVEETQKKDGKTATFEFNDSSDTNAAPVTGNGTMTRVAAGPKGSHAFSGSWRTTSYGNVSDNALTFTYKVDGDMLSMTSPTGQSYNAKLDGPDAAYAGDPGTTTVSVKKLGKNGIQESDKRNGKVISVAKMTVSADGKTMTIAVNDMLRGSTSSFVATKQ
jgi:hypothetical protein